MLTIAHLYFRFHIQNECDWQQYLQNLISVYFFHWMFLKLLLIFFLICCKKSCSIIIFCDRYQREIMTMRMPYKAQEWQSKKMLITKHTNKRKIKVVR